MGCRPRALWWAEGKQNSVHRCMGGDGDDGGGELGAKVPGGPDEGGCAVSLENKGPL